ncbi:MAG TPA: MFS transporter [Methylomirabilota bacterium]|nr:MFS transporter [Methylomirabilota bacterium]
MSSTALLCLISLCSCFSMGAFSPLLPEIGRANELADWQLGVVAGALGFARMAAAIPSGWLAGRYLGTTLCASPALMLAGTVLLATSGSFPLLVLGRLILGFAYTLGTVGGLIALLLDDRGPGASMRLNVFEFSAMIGVLGGLGLVGVLPGHWGWGISLLIASSPLLLILAAVPIIRRRFPDGQPAPDAPASRARATRRADRMSPTLWTMFAVGVVLALAWSSVSQFLLPLRATREFGLDRAGVSGLLMLAQSVDLVALLPVGRLADRLGRTPVLGFVIVALGLGTAAVGLGSLPWFVAGCAGFGLGLAGWMLPVGVIREHTRAEHLAWRMGLYRVGVDAAMFFGPFASGLLGEENARVFVTAVGALALVVGGRLLLAPAGRRAPAA